MQPVNADREGDAAMWRRVPTNGISMATRVAGIESPSRLPLLFLHGFPELGHSWRHQLRAVTAAGYSAIVPDLRGYGRTGSQGAVEDYRMANLAADVLGLIDGLGIDKVVLVGHDFGGALAWTLARDHRDRVLGIASLNTPYTRRTEVDLVETMRRTRGSANYMVTFQAAGVGEALLGANVAATFRALMRRSSVSLPAFRRLPERLQALPATLFTGEPAVMGEALLGEEELSVYIEAFERNGFTGPLNWYRNLRRNWEDTANVEDRVEVPALMIAAENDYFLPPATLRGMSDVVRDLETHVIAGCGHWTQQEKPEAVNALLLDWLRRRMSPAGVRT